MKTRTWAGVIAVAALSLGASGCHLILWLGYPG